MVGAYQQRYLLPASGPAVFVLLSHTWQGRALMPALLRVPAGSLRDQLVTGAEGALPRLRHCHLGTTWLYSSAFISLTCYLQLGKGRNGGRAHREVAVVGLLNCCQFRSWDLQDVRVPVSAVLSGSAHQLQVERLQVRSGRMPRRCCGSCNRLEVPPEANTPCAAPGERQPLPQKVWSPLADSQSF